MKNISLAVFHYHFQPGGVTTVASLSVRALLEHGWRYRLKIDEIIFICGRKENTEEFLNQEIRPFAGKDVKLKAVVIPELNYLDDSVKHNVSQLSAGIYTALDKYRGWLWWIHNYQVGKNPVFTKVLTRYLRENKEQKALLHIHDFPECGRPDNYRFMRDYTADFYPEAGNIRYITINSRDRKYLIDSGLSAGSVFLLSNPVPDTVPEDNQTAGNKILEEKEKSKLQQILYDNFCGIFPGLDRNNPYALYPVRTIRRKNILEAGLLAVLSGFNLIVTLPGISDQEKNYSDLVKSCFESSLIPGIWGSGSTLYPVHADFKDVIKASDFIISSSLIEGFGYLFLDALRWGKPLAARYIDIIDSFQDIFDNTATYFYKTVDIMLSEKEKTVLKKNYLKNISKNADILEPEIASNLEAALETLFNSPYTDFSYLPSDFQHKILQKTVASPEYRENIRNINSELIFSFEKLVKTTQSYDAEKMKSYFSLESYASGFFEAVKSFNSSTNLKNQNAAVSKNLLRIFSGSEYSRLLLSE